MSDHPAVAEGRSMQRALLGAPELGYGMKGASISGEHLAETVCALPDHKWNGNERNVLKEETRLHAALALAAGSLLVSAALLAWNVVLHTQLNLAQQSQTESLKSIAAENRKDGGMLPPCEDGWIWYQNKCYHFSEAQGNWTEAKDSCAARNSTLAMIDTQKELDFLLRHKGDPDRWIGLRRDIETQPWVWVDSSKFNDWFKVEDFAECAYLNHGIVKSLECYSKRQWICSQTPYIMNI